MLYPIELRMHRGEECMNRHSPVQALFAERSPAQNARLAQNELKTRPWFLSTPFHKYDPVCGEGFLAQTRRERRAYPSGVCKERATTSGTKRTAAQGCVAFRFWLRCSSVTAPLRGLLPRRASPQPQIDATNV